MKQDENFSRQKKQDEQGSSRYLAFRDGVSNAFWRCSRLDAINDAIDFDAISDFRFHHGLTVGLLFACLEEVDCLC